MLYLFDAFELDVDQIELRRNGVVVPIEPQVFALLRLLVESRDRMVSKEEVVEKVWSGRFVSDSAVSSRIKSARRALGDDGKEQRFIRTLHGQGFRFLAEVRTLAPPRPAPPTERRTEDDGPQPGAQTRPSIAVF